MADHETTLASHGYRLVTRAGFYAAKDVPAGNSRAIVGRLNGAFIVYDPNGGEDCWLLVGDDRAELALDTVAHIREGLAQYAGPKTAVACSGCKASFSIPTAWLPHKCDDCGAACLPVEPQASLF